MQNQTPLQAQLGAFLIFKKEFCSRWINSSALRLPQWVKTLEQREGMVDAAEPGYSGHWASAFPAVAAEQTDCSPLLLPWRHRALQCKHWAKHPQPWEDPSPCTHSAGSAVTTARQLLGSLLKISSEKQTGFVPLHPVNTQKKISTLYKEQQRYNLNMQQLQTIYTEKQAYTNRTGPFITLQFWGSFWRKSQQMNKIRPKDVASERDLLWNVTQHPHLSPAHTSITLPAAHSPSHSSWTPFLYRGRFLSMFWYCTTVNMVLITRNNLQRLISIIRGHHLIVGIQVVQQINLFALERKFPPSAMVCYLGGGPMESCSF